MKTALTSIFKNSLTRRAGLAALLGAAAAISMAAPHPAMAEDKVLKVGIMSGEDEDVWRAVAAEALKKGLKIETVVFNDYTQPNEALSQGEVDANAFQHQPYLDNQIATNGYKIVPVGYTGVWPIGLYSKKHRTLPPCRKVP
jgi:D-methionine transport system substrate-binding protein